MIDLWGYFTNSHVEGGRSISEGRGGVCGQEELGHRKYRLMWQGRVGKLCLLYCFNRGLLYHGALARTLCPEQPSAQKAGGEQEGKATQPTAQVRVKVWKPQWSETWAAHSQNRLPCSEETSSGPHSAQENPKHSGCLLLFQRSAPCCSSSMLPAGSTLCPAPAARAKSNSSTWRQHGNRKPLLGCMLWDKSLNLLDFNLLIHKMVTH